MVSVSSDISHFDIIPYTDLSPESSWTKLGQESFGCVFKGEYLTLDVAIKEVLQSTEYDMHKYLQREVKVMQEARHPNIVQYLGLSVAPTAPDEPRRLLIISEYLPRGNLRHYLTSRSLPFPWRLRISFAIDICRGVAYLHARNCLHRDLKGENLLVTENERIKLCDFGFARIAARNEEEMRRMSYCGTDGYMSPEILLGEDFDISTDIFSLGVILVEILSRKLVDNNTFVRQMPDFGISSDEVVMSASPHCPPSLVTLALACIHPERSKRPKIREVLSTLQRIEIEVLQQESRGIGVSQNEMGTWNVGSLGFSGTLKMGSMRRLVGHSGVGGQRPSAPRLPSFDGKISLPSSVRGRISDSESGDESDDDVAALALADVSVEGPPHKRGHGNGGESEAGLLQDQDLPTGYSTMVIRGKEVVDEEAPTLMPFPRPGRHGRYGPSSSLPSLPSSWIQADLVAPDSDKTLNADGPFLDAVSRLTERTSTLSVAAATANYEDLEADEADDVFHSALIHPGVDASAPPPSPLHRFSLIKPGLQRFLGVASVGLGMGMSSNLTDAKRSSSADALAKRMSGHLNGRKRTSSDEGVPIWGAKCGVCEKKLGIMKPWLECDECGLRCHIKCSDECPPGCPSLSTAPDSTAVPPVKEHEQQRNRSTSPPVSQPRQVSKLVKKQRPVSGKGKLGPIAA